MLPKSLKKLVLRKELALVTHVIEAMDPNLCVQNEAGSYLLGNQQTHKNKTAVGRSPICLEEETIGWVSGGEKASVAAELLSSLARRDFEKRTITQDLLNKYKEITLLFRLSEQILETLDVAEIAQLVINEAQQVLPSDGGCLMLLRETTNMLESVASFPQISVDHQLDSSLPMGHGLIGKIAATGRGEIVNNVLGDPRALDQPVESKTNALATGESQLKQLKQKRKTLICIPLKNKEQLIGVISLYRTQHKPYHAEDFKLLTTLASHVASVISVLKNEQQLKESRQNDFIFHLSHQIRNSLELSDILQTAVDKIQAALRLDRCFVLWHRYNDSSTSLSDSSDHHQSLESRFVIDSEAKAASLEAIKGTYGIEVLGDRLIKSIYQQKIVNVEDIHHLDDDCALRNFLQQRQCHALLALPMMTRTGHTGLLCCGGLQPRRWEEDELRLLRAVSNQLIIAIDQAELYEQSRKAAKVAQEKAQALESAMSELKKVQIQLVHTEKMSSLGQMVAGIAHEINNPISFIHGNLSHLELNMKDLLDLIECYQAEVEQPTAAIQEACDEINFSFLSQDIPKLLASMRIGTKRIKELVLSLRIFAQLDQAEFNEVDIHQGIDSALLLAKHRFQPSAFTLQTPTLTTAAVDDRHDISQQAISQQAISQQTISQQEPAQEPAVILNKHYGALPPIPCYANQLNQVFTHLINNALDALEISQKDMKELTIITETEGEFALIRIIDNGPGIESHIKHKIFDPFFTTKDVGSGTGLGLSISYQIVSERHRGSLQCHTEAGHGCEFVIKIPLARTE